MPSERDRDAKSPSGRARASETYSSRTSSGPHQDGGSKDELRSVRLTRKYADIIDGVDLTNAHVGDRLQLSRHDAEVLIAEGWAEHAVRRAAKRAGGAQVTAADRPRRHKPTKK
jgi:hypothetical protein